VAQDLGACGVDDRDLTLEDRDERIGGVADAVEHLADRRASLVTQRAESRELCLRVHWAGWKSHRP
jgi:hypothetical protein